MDVIFFTDLCQHLNELNKTLQEPNKTNIGLIDLICIFEAKLKVYSINILVMILQLKTTNIFQTISYHQGLKNTRKTRRRKVNWSKLR